MSNSGSVVEKRKSRRKKWLYVIIGLYLITWIWGVPATHAKIAIDICREYGEAVVSTDGNILNDSTYPNIWFEFSIPITPFVVINQYSWVFGGLWGEGYRTVDLWYVFGTKRIYENMLWIA